MCRLVALALFAVLWTSVGQAAPYWISYDPNNGLPEDCGWTRNWGNWQGQYQGPGAVRTIEDGILTYDSLYDAGVADFNEIERPGQMDPGPGEIFVAEWRLKVDTDTGSGDASVALFSDAAWGLGFGFTVDHIRSIFEGYLNIPFAPGVFHDYRVVSADMRSYQLFVDGVLTHQGALANVITQSNVSWGDGVQGAASVHHWAYLRFGVVPEPRGLTLLLWVGAWRCARRV